MTGGLAYLAFKAIQAAGLSGRKLFFYFYFLSSAFTICTSNDIVILILTPIIFYCTKVVKISPYPMLFSQFFTANICSMVLVIGNPVNLIVANANGLGFTQYSNWMAAPAIIGSITCCFVMYLLFRKDINVTFDPPVLNPELCLKDKRGIAFHGCVLFITRLLLGVGDIINAEGYIICAIAAICSGIYNAIFWPWDLPAKETVEGFGKGIESSPQKLPSLSQSPNSSPERDYLAAHVEDPSQNVTMQLMGMKPTSSIGDIAMDDVASFKRHQLEVLSQDTQKKFAGAEVSEVVDSDEVRVEDPTAKACIVNCPWAVLPFVFGMFTLVNALNTFGWIDAFSSKIIAVIPENEGNSMRAIAISTFLMTTISFVLCMLLSNQPASILLAQVLIAPSFDALPSVVRTGGMLGVLEGANVGGCWSIMGALAGILWSTILRNKGIKIGYLQFMKIGFKVMPLVTFVVALIIWAEAVGKAKTL
jgi:Na+/H+ antiporter NhaD/arsenite permease-like protein